MSVKTNKAIIISILFTLVFSLFLNKNQVYQALPVANNSIGILPQLNFQINGDVSSLSSAQQEAAENNLGPYEIDTAKAYAGLLQIKKRDRTGGKMKLLVSKGTEKYSYTIGQKNEEFFPLQMGSGQYTIEVLENIGGTQYRLADRVDVFCEIADPTAVFLHSTQIINWNFDMTAVKQARAITASLSSREDQVEAIVHYIAENFSYDWDKLNKADSPYLPNLEAIFSQKKGICYDYAGLLAAMLRSVGIPCRLCMGYSELLEGYHAWNEVYLNGEWLIVDTTIDAQCYQKNQGYTLFKNIAQYHATRVY